MPYHVNQAGQLVYEMDILHDPFAKKLGEEHLWSEISDRSIVIPGRVVAKGSESVERYLLSYLKKIITSKRQQQRKKWDRVKSINEPLSIQHKGHVLSGRVVYGGSNYKWSRWYWLDIILEEPAEYTGTPGTLRYEEGLEFGKGAFTETGDLTNEALELANQLLTKMFDEVYQKMQHRRQYADKYDLATKLNGK